MIAGFNTQLIQEILTGLELLEERYSPEGKQTPKIVQCFYRKLVEATHQDNVDWGARIEDVIQSIQVAEEIVALQKEIADKIVHSSPVSERTDWDAMVDEINALHARLQMKPTKKRFPRHSGEILNAYREGDISFEDAIQALETLN